MADKMSRQDIFSKVSAVIKDQLDPSVPIEENSKFTVDLGADSLEIVELVMAFEDEFGIEIPDAEAEKIASVGDAINFIETHQKEEA